MEKYVSTIMEIVEFDVEDVITTSDQVEGDIKTVEGEDLPEDLT